MLKFKQITDPYGAIQYIETSLSGYELLNTPKLNKASAFSQQERIEFDLLGKLPCSVETLDQQVARVYQQFHQQGSPLEKYVYLGNLHNMNETLFYRVISEHLKEILPIIYTPTIGEAVQQFSHEYRRSRGIYLSYPDRDKIDMMLNNRINPEIDLIVMTDGEGVLGIGDQGVGGMSISIGKLMVYILCGGINPHRVLPIQIDVGTNNETLLNDPMYLGWRHPRLTGQQYDDFIGDIVKAIQEKFPNVYLHWEDFGRENARRNLNRFRDTMLTFNDDIQGTGAVTLAAVLSAVKAAGRKLTEERIVIFGAGTAGVGIADQICDAMIRQGLKKEEALEKFWLVDRQGLLTEDDQNLMPFQKPYARKEKSASKMLHLTEVVKHIGPTLLIGCSTQMGAFSESIIKMMAEKIDRPIIFPLSNPTEKAEAIPQDLYHWTNGKALIATGSPFEPIQWDGKQIPVSQCNNAFVFPGIGLGVITAKAKRLSDEMIWVACETLANASPSKHNTNAPLLPDLEHVQEVSIQIALAVAKQAEKEGLAQRDTTLDLEKCIRARFWRPKYWPYKKCL